MTTSMVYSQSFQYIVKANSSSASSDGKIIYRNSMFPDELVENIRSKQLNSSWDVFQYGRSQYPNQPFLGFVDQNSNEAKWLTYAEVENSALQLGTSLLDKEIIPESTFPSERFPGAKKLRILGIFTKNCVEWFLTEQAANAYNFTLLPLYDALGSSEIQHIMRQTKCETVIGSVDCIRKLIEHCSEASFNLRNLVIIDCEDESRIMSEFSSGKPYNIVFFNDLLNTGKIRPIKCGDLSSVITISYTSGTTGIPKGVILTARNLVACVSAAMRGPMSHHFDLNLSHHDRHYSYLPLAHVYERIICNLVYFIGASICISSGGASKILQDLVIFRPTILIAVPKVLSRMHEGILETVEKNLSPIKKAIFWGSLKIKMVLHSWFSYIKNPLLDYLVFGHIRAKLGDNLRYILVGSASLDETICDTIKVLTSVPICEGYGLTETFGGAFCSLPSHASAGSIGGPLPCIEFCLKSVPETEYTGSSSGELLLRGPSIFPGYFMNADSTSEVIDSEGWFHTGDIALISSHQSLRIIDRTKSILKLQQGEYVSSEKLETIYRRCHYINQIYVHGDSTRDALVGIVTLKEHLAKEWAAENSAESSHIYENKDFKTEILSQLYSLAVQNHLKGFEKIKKVHCFDGQFAIENDMMTPTLKMKKNNIRKVFAKQIENMYDELKNERSQNKR